MGSRSDAELVLASDAELIVESVSRPSLFSVVYERHLRSVALYAARRVGADLAEDVAAEVFVRAFRARRAFRVQHDTALPWLLGIANHVVGDHRRAERRRLLALQRLSVNSVADVQEGVALLPVELVRALQRLPSVYRDTLLLVVWGELSYEEAGRALGVPVGTVRSRIARARSKLARAINADVGTILNGEARV
jgi:RNA polymerase sigma factor (sigma-70 family)